MRISIEGNISSGKSTLLKNLVGNEFIKKHFDTHLEPIGEWTDELALFYSNPKRWGLLMNSTAIVSMHSLYSRFESNSTIQERSIHSAFHAFVKCLDSSPVEKKLMSNLYYSLDQFSKYDLMFYVRTDPDMCVERLRNRGTVDSDADSDYIHKLHEAHQEWLDSPTTMNLPYRVIVIDGNKEQGEVVNEVLAHIQEFVANKAKKHS